MKFRKKSLTGLKVTINHHKSNEINQLKMMKERTYMEIDKMEEGINGKYNNMVEKILKKSGKDRKRN